MSSAEKLRAMHLSGTISIPPRFPDVAQIIFAGSGNGGGILVTAKQRLSPKLLIKRTFFLEDIGAVFVPDDPTAVTDFEAGDWYESEELKSFALDNTNDPDGVEGILYVREQAQSLLEVEAGLTAAESAEYYPPLPDDRSVNHYRMDGGDLGGPIGCSLH